LGVLPLFTNLFHRHFFFLQVSITSPQVSTLFLFIPQAPITCPQVHSIFETKFTNQKIQLQSISIITSNSIPILFLYYISNTLKFFLNKSLTEFKPFQKALLCIQYLLFSCSHCFHSITPLFLTQMYTVIVQHTAAHVQTLVFANPVPPVILIALVTC